MQSFQNLVHSEWIYEAVTADLAAAQLDTFEEKLAEKYASIAPIWRQAWQELTPFFAFDPTIQKIIYSPNTIESLSRIRWENSSPDRFLARLIAKIDQDPQIIPAQRSHDETDLLGLLQLRERQQKSP